MNTNTEKKSCTARTDNRPVPRLPSGYGTIRYLGSGRTRPYAVHPPAAKVENEYIRPGVICYVSNWYVGFAVLTSFHAGRYVEGMEDKIEELLVTEGEIKGIGEVAGMICEDYKKLRHRKRRRMADTTVKELYEQLYEYKFGPHAPVRLSHSRKNQMNAAFKLIQCIHHRTLDDLSIPELQRLVNGIAGENGNIPAGKSCSTVQNVVMLIKDLYRYALPRELCNKQYGLYVRMPRTREVKHHEAFSDWELEHLWKHKDDPVVKMILVMCYSGFRVSAFIAPGFITDLEGRFFKGGIKTNAGKGRVVPIHSALLPVLESMTVQGGTVKYMCGKSTQQFRRDMKNKLTELGLRELTPHSCRHTFNRLLEKANVYEADRKRLMGHSLKGDILNGTYGHRGLEELREQVEKINTPSSCPNIND